jgi:hypothetical protein
MSGGWANAGSVTSKPDLGTTDTPTPADQIQDAVKQLPADQKAALLALDQAVPLNTLTPAQITNLGSLNKDELGNLAKLDPKAIKSMLAQPADAFKDQVKKLDARGWPGANDKTAPADGKAWADPDAKGKPGDADKDKKAKKDSDAEEAKYQQRKAAEEARQRAMRFVDHVKTMNKAQQDALLAAVHNMI